MTIPFVDLRAQYASIQAEVDEAIRRVFEDGVFVKGTRVSAFEQEFAHLIGSAHCVGVGNGTDALFLILKALALAPGDEVIVPAWGWISAAEVVLLAGGTLVFADVQSNGLLSPETVRSQITERTRVIIAMHLYGAMCDVLALRALAEEHNLFLIEDCAQAHLSTHKNYVAGQIGHAAAFSFYPTKNLGAYGDAGAVVTNDEALATRIRRLANHGGLTKVEHLFEGVNSRLDALQAAILTVKLKHLRHWNQQRVQHAHHYARRLAGHPSIVLPDITDGHTFHLFVIRCRQRLALQQYLKAHGIESQIHYPRALPLEPAYAHRGFTAAQFPVAASLQEEVLSLPVYPELSEAQVDYICDHLIAFYQS
jgi:dTDP-4-amino-4,6-dideoxygalactose transaminase